MEKKSRFIIVTAERMHWLLASSPDIDFSTDHNNLILLFDPTAVVADMSETTLRKVLRWAVRLNFYNCICVHIPGAQNVWDNLISRQIGPSFLFLDGWLQSPFFLLRPPRTFLGRQPMILA